MCSVPTSPAAAAPTTRGPSMPAGVTMLGFIAATAGADTRTTAITPESGTTRDFMGGAGIPGERRLRGGLVHGDGAERHGGDSMAGGGILVPYMALLTTCRRS